MQNYINPNDLFLIAISMLEEDEKLLRELAKGCKDAKEHDRYLALHALSIGHPVALIAKIFCVDESAVYRWIERWKEERNLAERPKEGRPPALTEKEKEDVKKLIEENNPKKHDVNASLWDTRELQTYFARKGRKISRETLRMALKGMGARYVKAQLHYPEADEQLRRQFARKFLKDMQSRPNSVVVLFQDEMAVSCSPRKGYGWTFEERLVVRSPQSEGKKKLSCFGAVNPLKGEVIQMSSKNSKASSFIRFLRKIEAKYTKKKIWLYVDNLAVHRSKKTEEFLRKNPRMSLRFLPPYSPDLNIQEQWWNYERQKFLNNSHFRSTHQLATAISWFGRKAEPEQVMSVCSIAPIESVLH